MKKEKNNCKISSSGLCLDLKGMLSFLILFLLSKKDMDGQEIASELERRRGEKPSPGTIYPALKSLKEAGLIVESNCPNNKSIKYKLTDKGNGSLQASKEKFKQIFKDIL
ncbi:MAG TPA: PadR family transcriptional regulator [Candidatus Nanoarchaeia archaeon]|nr:PadR family transcriptional regulator [Candidatus Nanoarchaeia archaeon]